MQRVIFGLLKGLIVGGACGYGVLRLGLQDHAWAYLACALVGAVVGVVCGRPPWRSETIWTPVVKLIVGGVIGVGLAALGLHVPGAPLPSVMGVSLSTQHPAILSLVVGALYGMFVEVDDGGKSDSGAPSSEKKLPAGPQRKLKG